MDTMQSYLVANKDTELCITIYSDDKSIFNRFKTGLWNFFLPSHIRLKIKKGTSEL